MDSNGEVKLLRKFKFFWGVGWGGVGWGGVGWGLGSGWMGTEK